MREWDSIPKQTQLVEEGKTGDCWRCCIAAILGLPANEVPHFLEQAIEKSGSEDPVTQEWLNERGYYLAMVRGTIWFPRYHGKGEAPPRIRTGPTERSRKMGAHHATVWIGEKMVYDPHPSNAGLTAVTDEYLVFRL